LILQDVQTDRSVGIDVGMIDLCDEVAFGRSEGVVSWEVDVEEEDTSSIGTIVGTNDGGLPMEVVVFMRAS